MTMVPYCWTTCRRCSKKGPDEGDRDISTCRVPSPHVVTSLACLAPCRPTGVGMRCAPNHQVAHAQLRVPSHIPRLSQHRFADTTSRGANNCCARARLSCWLHCNAAVAQHPELANAGSLDTGSLSMGEGRIPHHRCMCAVCMCRLQGNGRTQRHCGVCLVKWRDGEAGFGGVGSMCMHVHHHWCS